MSNNRSNTRLSALMFPGQGPQNAEMVSELQILISRNKHYHRKYNLVCEVLGNDPVKQFEKNGLEYLNRNEVSSVLTVLYSVLVWEELQVNTVESADYLIGYSVGQCTALYVSGVIGYESLIQFVAYRAQLMNDCFREVKGMMLSVIGVEEAAVKQVIDDISRTGRFVAIGNYNCDRQYSVSGESSAVMDFLKGIQLYSPKKTKILPVEGAWHSKMLIEAETKLREYLKGIQLSKQRIPIIDNVTGKLLPSFDDELKEQLSLHVSNPVMWSKSIKFAINCGCDKFIEVGYGTMLTKFGMYINRKVEFVHTMEALGESPCVA